MHKKVLCLFFSIIVLCNLFSINVTAKTITHDDLIKMSDYEYYCTFAEALKNHDAQTISLIVDGCSKYHGTKYVNGMQMLKTCEDVNCQSYKQFEYKNVEVTDYKVELLDKSREKYDDGFVKAAKITLNIKKSDNSLFPKGKQEYYAYFYPYGMYGIYKFYPYSQKEVESKAQYQSIIYASNAISTFLSDYGSISENKLKNVNYTSGFIHYFYHIYLQEKYPDGINKTKLTSEVNKFMSKSGQIPSSVLNDLWQRDGTYFKGCGHGMSFPIYKCKKITRNKKTGYYTFEIWYYSDAASMNVCRKIKYTYDKNGDDYILKKVDCYYSNKYDVLQQS